jgi:hypothetical protein
MGFTIQDTPAVDSKLLQTDVKLGRVLLVEDEELIRETINSLSAMRATTYS